MKKIATALLVTSLFSANCFAKGPNLSPNACGYSDYFHLSDDSPNTLVIASLAGDGNVTVVQKDKAFYVKDASSCPTSGGDAKVRYQKDGDNYCDLVVHDSAYIWSPDVEAKCKGNIEFTGIKSDGVFTSSYSLSFS